MRIFRAILIALLLAALAVAQTSAPTQTPPPGPQVQQIPSVPPENQDSGTQPAAKHETGKSAPPGTSAERESKITPEQAERLLRSVDEILKFVSKDTGLPIKHPVKRELADREQVWHFIRDRLEHDQDAKRLERSEVVLKKFGLVPRDFNLRSFLLKLMQEQVAGFYDAKSKTVYLLDWVPPEQQKQVLAHELTHALQDQNFGLEEMMKEARKNDSQESKSDERLAALQAVTEGQAMLVLLDYSLAPVGSSVADQPKLVDAVGAGLNAGPGMAVFNRAPLFLQQVLLFPYRYGTAFERDVLVAGGKKKAFAGVLRNLPQDTRQILHPESYLHHQLIPPMKPLELEKLARGYEEWDQSAMGEFDTRLLLNVDTTDEIAERLSSEWRGGHYWAALIPTAAGKKAPNTGELALAYVSRWASPDAARQFAAIYSEAVPKRYDGAKLTSGSIPASTEDVASIGLQVKTAPRLTVPASWQTNEGLVWIEAQGDTVLVLENFDPETATRIRQAVFQ